MRTKVGFSHTKKHTTPINSSHVDVLEKLKMKDLPKSVIIPSSSLLSFGAL